jgi:hypothetical protein
VGYGRRIMEIRFNSTLTAEDELRVAQVLLAAVGKFLESMPIAYAIRIRTSGGNLLQRDRVQTDLPKSDPPSPVAQSG